MSKHVVVLVLLFMLNCIAWSNDFVISNYVGPDVDGVWTYPIIKLENNSASTINLSGYTFEYYLYDPSVDAQTDVSTFFNSQKWGCYKNENENLGTSVFDVSFVNLGGTFGNTDKKANVKAVVSFTSVSLPAGQYIEFDYGIHRTDWGAFFKADDWSYQNVSTYANNSNIVLKNNGTVVWGNDPTGSIQTAMLSVSSYGGGTVTLQPSQRSYLVGTQVTVTAVPDEGYKFSKWTNGFGNTNPLTITVTKDLSFFAYFKATSDNTDDIHDFSSWDLLSDGHARINGHLQLRDLFLGADGTGNKFVLHSRSGDDVTDKGDYLELGFESKEQEGKSIFGHGLVFKPYLGQGGYGANIGIGTNNPKSKLHVEGDIFASGNLIVRKNSASANKVAGLDAYRYYEGLSTGDEHDTVGDSKGHPYGLHINALSWDFPADPNDSEDDGWIGQDPIFHHGGKHSFLVFDNDESKKERKVFEIRGDYASFLKSDGAKSRLSSGSLHLETVYSPQKDVLVVDKEINIDAENGSISNTNHTRGTYSQLGTSSLSINKTIISSDKFPASHSYLTPGNLSLTRGWGNWFDLKNYSNNGRWMLHNDSAETRFEIGYDPDGSVEKDEKWGLFSINKNGGISIGTNDTCLAGEKLLVNGGVSVKNDLRVEGALSVARINGDLNAENSTITAKEFKVGDWVITDAPDFVFKEDYDLKPLSEVEKFIKKKNHLPGIPSAEEIKTEGFDLVKMNMLLLQKVEELTLHSIDQQKQIKKLQETIEDMQ